MNKKFLVKLISFTLCLSLLAGCSSSQSSSQSTATEASQENTATTEASAQESNWPEGSITIVVPSKAGGFADIHGRVLSEYLQRVTGKPCAVVNNADGGGTAGPEQVRTSKPDGLTLLYMHTSFPISTYTGSYKANIDTDFTSVSSVVNGGNNALVVSSKAPYSTLEELVEYAKANPETVKWGSMAGATSHFMMALTEEATGIKFKMVDAGSEAEKITAILGGFVDIVNVGMSNADQYVKSGEMKVIAVIGEERDTQYNEYPTAVEQGYNIVWSGEFQLYGPAGIPADIVTKINETLDAFGTTDEVSKDAITKQGAFVVERTTEETLEYMKSTNEELKVLVEGLGLAQ